MAGTWYEDKELKIVASQDVGYESFCIKNKEGDESCYKLPIRLFNEVHELKRGELEGKLNEIDPKITESLKKANISIDSAHLAMCLSSYNAWETIRADRESERMSFML